MSTLAGCSTAWTMLAALAGLGFSHRIAPQAEPRLVFDALALALR